MVSSTHFFTTLLIGATAIVASPALVSRAGVIELDANQIAVFKPYALLARAAFCSPAKWITWSCGTACDALPGMDVQASSGSGLTEAGWFIGYYPELQTIVVSNQGTDPVEAESSLTDADFFLTSLDPALFPGVPSSVEVHNGFKYDQASTALTKLSAVNALLTKYGPSSITLTGLGRGGAVSFLDALYFSVNIPNAKIKLVTHGMPRIGNQAFAEYIDAHSLDVSRITNKNDPLPILPGRFLGFLHSSGEKHILENGSWVACDGQDNTDKQCSTGAVPNIFEGNIEDNKGPYNGITIDSTACAT